MPLCVCVYACVYVVIFVGCYRLVSHRKHKIDNCLFRIINKKIILTGMFSRPSPTAAAIKCFPVDYDISKVGNIRNLCQGDANYIN